MTDTAILSLAQKALLVSLMVSAPVLGFGLVVGLVVSVFQAATQIQEMTLTFIPKMIAVGVALVIFGPWMLTTITQFTSNLMLSLPSLVR